MTESGDVPDAPAAWYTAPLASVTADGRGNGASAGEALLRIAIPADVEAMSTGEAQAWREATRPLFVRLLGDGYRVAGFISTGAGRYYVLARADGVPGV
jgi:predicted GNAT superfamily acetyltransferase